MKVAVVDSPISIEHPDLIANVIPLGSINTEALARQALGGKF
ncbi:hypothetical protein [Agarilytica rhodophyticola]|nr:hypothetical protein [Agarilytica rhodophyticola]